MRLLLACFILLLGVWGQATPTKRDWIWWKLPSSVSYADRLGFTRDQILKMGCDKWTDYVLERDRDGDRANQVPENMLQSLAFEVDGYQIVYAVCARQRNDNLIRKLPAKKQEELRQLRKSMWRFGMAVIALEDTLAGGGTYSIHCPRSLALQVEDCLHEFLTKPVKRDHQFDGTDKLVKILSRYRFMRTAPRVCLGGWEADLKDVNWYANLADNYLHKITKLTNPLGQQKRLAAREFIYSWGLDYLNIRFDFGK